MFKRLIPLPAFIALLSSAPALADDKPAGLLQTKTATSGSTDVAKTGFETVDRAAATADDATELKLVAGGLLASGNSRSVALTASGQFRIRREANQLSVLAAANYGRSAADADGPMETTIENYQGRARYDRFLSKQLALFVAIGARHDRFQGLDLRFNAAPGLAYYVIDEKTQQLWGELGYDLQRDVRTSDAIAAAAEAGTPIDKAETRHNARLFLGYNNSISESVSLNTGLEYLLGLSPWENELNKRNNWRLTWDAGVTAKVSDKFALSSTLSVRYDNNPLPEVRRTDALMAMNLVYTLL